MKGHVWVKREGDSAYIGLTSLGASLAKEIVHIDLPADDEEFDSLEPIASYETIKSVSEVYAPFECRIKRVNEKLLEDPALMNKKPYEGGWIAEIEALGEKDNTMDVEEACEYFKRIVDKEKEKYEGIYD